MTHGFRLKKSFGTALKFFGGNALANISVYAKLALLMYLAWGDHDIADRIRDRTRWTKPTLPSLSETRSTSTVGSLEMTAAYRLRVGSLLVGWFDR